MNLHYVTYFDEKLVPLIYDIHGSSKQSNIKRTFKFLKHYKFLLSIDHERIMSHTYAMNQKTSDLEVVHKFEGCVKECRLLKIPGNSFHLTYVTQ
ncbi:hypothetical protein EYC84_003236 [Monilinia fructicola]|uniref:Uncharacterized protein n=1 Tax=Monilinia fructicola TaxID=38448 RepID=A0A5M9JXL2_MONFR|nr:hypothetical protein EYC84_003236 [Monilinia fructicola]